MKTLKFESAYQDHVEVPDAPNSGRPNGGGWRNGDVFDVTDLDAAVLLRAPGFSEFKRPSSPAKAPAKPAPADAPASTASN